MWILFLVMAIVIILLLFAIKSYRWQLQKKVEKDTEIEIQNQEIRKKNIQLEDDTLHLIAKIKLLNNNIKELKDQQNIETNNLKNLQKTIEETSNSSIKLSQQAFANYCDVLMRNYENKEKEYDGLIKNLEDSYSNKQDEVLRKIDIVKGELESLQATRAAIIEASLREQEIKDNLAFYCLSLSDIDIADIKTLEAIKSRLSKPRILSMLIWQTYYQKPLKALSANILGTDTVTGIYKITNTKNNMVYIGQAVDIAKRWTDHAKYGLGIDTPARNKLYKAMLEDGLSSFSWELLEQCDKAELDEKERYYISLYDSYNYGYNSNTGISK